MNVVITTRTFKPRNNARLHVVHEGKSRDGVLVTLCGQVFNRERATNLTTTARATCGQCVERDNPFLLSIDQILGLIRARKAEASADKAASLVIRDLVNAVTLVPTMRGLLVLEDHLHPIPWADDHGILHARTSLSWGRGACGATLEGLHLMSYSRLAKLREASVNLRPSCLECLADAP